MNFKLIYKDSQGTKTTSSFRIPFLAFVKHATFAGINHTVYPYYQHPHYLFRFLSALYEFFPSFYSSNCFQLAPGLSADPTEKAYLSNKVGRAIADYLSKRIYGARFTHCYEDAMAISGHTIAGQRPDFYCDALGKQFSVEAKGYSSRSVSDNLMGIHKGQSQTGPLQVNFSVASVAYNLYHSPAVKFYDPINDNMSYDFDLNSQLRDMYYQNALALIEALSKDPEESDIPNYMSYMVNLPAPGGVEFLVHKIVHERNWKPNVWLSSDMVTSNDEWLFYDARANYKERLAFVDRIVDRHENVYIDLDGIGLKWST